MVGFSRLIRVSRVRIMIRVRVRGHVLLIIPELALGLTLSL